MGPPPKDTLVRKLLFKYIKFNVQRSNFSSVKKYYLELQDCWQKKGVSHQDCEPIVKKIDIAQENDQKEFMDTLKYMKS